MAEEQHHRVGESGSMPAPHEVTQLCSGEYMKARWQVGPTGSSLSSENPAKDAANESAGRQRGAAGETETARPAQHTHGARDRRRGFSLMMKRVST